MVRPTTLSWQGSLLGAGRPAVATEPNSAHRRELTGGAWVDHVPGWLAGADDLFDELLRDLDWQAREMPMYGQLVAQPRLSAFWPLDEEAPRHVLLSQLADELGRRYDLRFGSVGANLYRSGRDSVAFHGDRHARGPRDPDTVVPVLSLGAPRRFLLRPRGGGPSVAYTPGPGDLLVMGGSCQRTWQHAVPKVASAGPRISVTFR